MAKQVKDIYIPKPDNVFWMYLGKSRYDLFMPRPPYKYVLPFKQLKLLKDAKKETN